MRSGDTSGRIGAIVLASAIVAAPFLALLIRAELGLVVMTLALGATSLLLRDALAATPPETQRWLRVVILVNAVLAIACVALAVWLLVASAARFTGLPDGGSRVFERPAGRARIEKETGLPSPAPWASRLALKDQAATNEKHPEGR